MYIYIKSEPKLWTVGFYDPQEEFHPESDHGNPDDAAKRVRWLNGGRDDAGDTRIEALEEAVRLLAQNCACTVKERMSGHRTGCTAPEVHEMLNTPTAEDEAHNAYEQEHLS